MSCSMVAYRVQRSWSCRLRTFVRLLSCWSTLDIGNCHFTVLGRALGNRRVQSLGDVLQRMTVLLDRRGSPRTRRHSNVT